VFHEFPIYHNARSKQRQNTKHEFREYRHSHFNSLLKGIHEFLSVLSTFTDWSRRNSGEETSTQCCVIFVCVFCKSGTGTAVLPTGHKRNYIYLSTLKPCNNLQAKNGRLQPRICSTYRQAQQHTARTHGTPVFLFPLTSMCQHELTQFLIC
jgi:hypothetical protein